MVDLRRSLELEDEPLVPRVTSAAAIAPLESRVPRSAPSGPTPAAPPPLPPRRAGPPPVPTQQFAGAGIQLPPSVPRPVGDPFSEPAEPRPPRSVTPDEKLEFFRAVVKQKEETLTRARAVYEQRDLEAHRLREVAVALKAQLDEALPQLARLRELPGRIEQLGRAHESERGRADTAEARVSRLEHEIGTSESDRRDLARALAEVEAELPGLRLALGEERKARSALSEELSGAKEAIQLAQDRISSFATEQSETRGNLEAVNAQYQEVSRALEQAEAERDRSEEESRTLQAERDAAIAERDLARTESDAFQEQARVLSRTLEEAERAHAALGSEQDWSRSSLEEAQGRLRALEEELGDARRQVEQLESTAATLSERSSEELATARAELFRMQDADSSLRHEADGLRSQIELLNVSLVKQEDRAKSELEAVLAREAQARKTLESKLADRMRELQAARHAGQTAQALEQQIGEALERSAQAEARAAELERQASSLAASETERAGLLEGQREQLERLESSLQTEREKRLSSEQKAGVLARELQVAKTELAGATSSLEFQVGEAQAQASQVSSAHQKAQDALRAEQQKSATLREQLKAFSSKDAEGTLRNLTAEVERLRAESAAQRKLREELMTANRKANESQASFQKEKRERESLAERVAELEASPGGEASGEVEKLRADVASLKKKLVSAESAREAAASLRSKVSRLEAQLKAKK